MERDVDGGARVGGAFVTFEVLGVGAGEALADDAIVLADKAYDTDAIRKQVEDQGGWANIPAKSNRKQTFTFSKWLYRYRNLVERFFNKLKQFRGIATRYDKRPENFLAAIKLASLRIWLRSYESTA